MAGRPRWIVINIHIGYETNQYLDYSCSHRTYCDKFGYEYLQVKENLVPDALPTWSKHAAALHLIDECDGIMIIDSDAEILADCPAFDSLLSSNNGANIFMALGHSFRPNAGMILLRGKSTVSKSFLSTLLDEREKPIPQQDQAILGGDNGHVINLLRRQKFKDRFFVLGAVWNNTTKPTDWDFIRHYTGPMRELAKSESADNHHL